MNDPAAKADALLTAQLHNDESRKTRVMCVDDHRDIRAVMQLVIDAEPDMTCVGCSASANALLDDVRRLNPDIVLVDATMPGKDPFDALRELNAEGLPVRSVVFTAWDKFEIVERTRASGAHGWIVKSTDPEQVVEIIRQIAAGGTYFPETQ
ncbi:MAG: response regulator transcription factor [Candidatus Hydrogenedentes bacterium]|nr:response regulator transcription factor [Candidatus Hydrogenedentota bacterium]